MKYDALIAGAGGLTGSFVLKHLIDDKDCEQVTVLSRSSKEASGKVNYHLFDFTSWEELIPLVSDRTRIFCCVGTTWKKTPNYEEYTRIDHEIPQKLAELGARQSCDKFLVVSALGASVKSRNFYTRMKGEMEADVLAAGNSETYILRPAQLIGARNEVRVLEGITQNIFKVINPLFVGPLKRYRGIKGSTVAKAMYVLSKKGANSSILLNDQLFELAKDA